MIYLLNMLIFHRKTLKNQGDPLDPLPFFDLRQGSTLILQLHRHVQADQHGLSGIHLPQLQVHQISRSFLQEGGGLDNFFAENHGEIHGENHGTVMANDINILYDHTCGGCFFWYATWNWWVLYDLYIYMDQTWGPNGPLKLGVWKIGHGLYDCPSLIHYRGSMNQKTGMLVDIPWYTLWLCQK